MNWLEIWSTGVYDFKLPPDQVWRLTPAQFAALAERFYEDRHFFDLELGWLRQLTAEPHRNRRTQHKPFKVEDFMIYGADGERTSDMSPKEQLDYVKHFLQPHFAARHTLKESRNG